MTGKKLNNYWLNTNTNNELTIHPIIHSIGHEIRTNADSEKYFWDCRHNDESICIFQYTIAGEGMLEINGQQVRQTASSTFLIERPGNYCYWLPDDSEFWEFKFISFTISTLPFWNYITSNYNRLFKMEPDSQVIAVLDEILQKISESKVETIYDNSILAYKFLMILQKYLKQNGTSNARQESIQLCLEYIAREYAKNISLTDIAESCHISPFYLSKYFKDVVGESPIQYLTKIRIRNSLSLLKDTDLSIEKIAQQCGFSSANYFAKVFKKQQLISPSEFRQKVV